MKKFKVTYKDFVRFELYCKMWLEILGLKSYFTSFKHLNISAIAGVRAHPDVRSARFKLAKNWSSPITDEQLERSALHECIHVLLWQFSDEARTFLTKPAKTGRFYAKIDRLEREEEAVVVTLENILMQLPRPQLAKQTPTTG